MSDEGAVQLVLADAQRQLANQESALNTLRTTAAAVVASASIVAAVFGAVLSAAKHRSGFSIGCEVVALALFAATIWASIVLLRPRRWHSQHDLGPDWIARIYDADIPSEITVAVNLAEYLNDYRVMNNPILRLLQRWLTFACVLLGLQVVAWALGVL